MVVVVLGGGKDRHFLSNPLCDDGNAASRFNKISRYYFQTAECKLTACLTAETNASVIRERPVRRDLCCSGETKGQAAAFLC